MSDLRAAIEAAEILESRRESDGLLGKLWFPNQLLGFESKKAEVWAFGGNRSGKTEWLMGLGASFGRFGVFDPRLALYTGKLPDFTPKRIWIISLDRDMARNIVQPKLFHNGATLAGQDVMIPDDEIEDWNITNQTLKLKCGSIFIFKTGESGPLAFQGADIDLALFDEVPEKDVYTETTLRIGAGRRLWIRGAATILPPPGQPGGVRWIYTDKVKPWNEAGRNEKTPHLDIFTLRMIDNPHLLQEEKDRVIAQYPPGSVEFRIRVLGELLPTIGGSPVYAHYERQYHENYALAPLVDGVRRYKTEPSLPLVLTMDFNPIDGVWLVGQYVNRCFRVIDEISLERSDIAPMTAEFRSRFPTHIAELWVYGDTTGRRAEVQTGESNFHLFQMYMQGYPVPIRYNLPSINPPVADRVASVNAILRPADGMKRFEHAPHCANLRDDLEGSKWKENGKIDKEGAKGRRSDGADAFGYWVSVVEPTVRRGAAPAKGMTIRTPSYQTSPSPGKFPAQFKGSKPRFSGGRAYVRGNA